MSVFICLAAIFLATTIFFAYKLSKLNKPKPPIEPNYDINKAENTDISIKNN